jgi:hypothetical protein
MTHIASPLARKSTLVSVSISQWTARKLDKRVTDETNRKYNASEDAGRYNKLLIASHHLETITGLVSKARLTHYAMTRPWADEGARILPNALYSKFTDAFRTIKRDFERAADEFCRNYPAFVAERQDKLNGMFNADDYPSASTIRDKFKMDLTILPFPDATDFRSDLDADTIADIRREIEATSTRAVTDAMDCTAQQIIKVVGHMSERLKAYKSKDERGTDEKSTRLYDSVVENVRELGELLPAFNFTNNAKLDAITQRIVSELCVEEIADLKKNPHAREAVAKSADEIVAEVEQFLA